LSAMEEKNEGRHPEILKATERVDQVLWKTNGTKEPAVGQTETNGSREKIVQSVP